MNDWRQMFDGIDLRPEELEKQEPTLEEKHAFLASNCGDLLQDCYGDFSELCKTMSPMRQRYYSAKYDRSFNVTYERMSFAREGALAAEWMKAVQDAVTRHLWKKFEFDAINVAELPDGFGDAV